MGKLLVALALAAVVTILFLGIYTLYKGGDLSKEWSNKLMRLRVVAQFVAIIIIMLVLWLSSGR